MPDTIAAKVAASGNFPIKQVLDDCITAFRETVSTELRQLNLVKSNSSGNYGTIDPLTPSAESLLQPCGLTDTNNEVQSKKNNFFVLKFKRNT
jgi:hypothetical protein